MSLLKLENIVAGYGPDVPILHGINIHLDAGEIVSIVGPNGAGKSTAMKAAFGLLNIHSGQVILEGNGVTGQSPETIVRRGVSYVPQTANVFPSLTVQENLELGGYFSSRAELEVGLERMYALFPPLRDKRRQPSGSLSGGQRQMVAMGRALMPNPGIVLMDEPTAGLSPKYAEEIFSLVTDINTGGAAILMVEQNAKHALMISTRGYVLVDGQNRHEGAGPDLVSDREVAEMFLGGQPVDQFLIFVNAYLIPGIVSGSVYALGAIGVTLLFGVLRFAHFAHGDVMTAGAYFALSAIMFLGLHPMAALPIAMAITALMCVGLDRVFYAPLRTKPSVVLIISSFGVALMVRASLLLIYGPESFYYERGIQGATEFFDIIRISERHIWIIASAIILMFTLHMLLTYTRLGKAMRAVSDSPELARLTGISTDNIILVTWIVGGSLAAVAGVFLAWDGFVHANMGWDLLLPMFAAAILGGLGRPYGAMVGGLIIGVAEELVSYPWFGEALLSPGYKTGVAFAIMVAMLIWRPGGLFSAKAL